MDLRFFAMSSLSDLAGENVHMLDIPDDEVENDSQRSSYEWSEDGLLIHEILHEILEQFGDDDDTAMDRLEVDRLNPLD